MKKLVTTLLLLGALVLSTASVSASPWDAGSSGNWKGSATPCKNSGEPPACPPHG